MKALSIRQPWAWLICNAGKDCENRQWRTSFRGTFYVHASAGMTRDEYYSAIDFVNRCVPSALPIMAKLPDFKQLERGGIVGTAELFSCNIKSESPWFVGLYGFMLRDATPIAFRPLKGSLGFFEVPEL